MPVSTYRSSASFGKRQEYIAVAELLRREFDVYMTLVDDRGIDCIIRQEGDGNIRYLDIQIKARSKSAKNPGTFAAMRIEEPRENYYFIFFAEAIKTYWIVPSIELIQEANQNKGGKNAGKYSIVFCNVNKAGPKARPRFDKYKDAFELLEWK